MPALGAVSSLATSCAVGVASDLAKAPDDRSRMLPVHEALAGLFPRGGLRRGSTVVVRGSTSLLFALLARATDTGSWAALVGLPNLGLRAAAELGVAVDRLALVRHPGADLPRVIAALLDGIDLVAVDPKRLTDSQIHRLSARTRHRGAVLLATGTWPGADLELTQEVSGWSGLGDGHGHLTTREVHIRATGRGSAIRGAEAWLHLPAADGTTTNAVKDPFETDLPLIPDARQALEPPLRRLQSLDATANLNATANLAAAAPLAKAALPVDLADPGEAVEPDSRRLNPARQDSLPLGAPVRRSGASDGVVDTLPSSSIPSEALPEQTAYCPSEFVGA